jgi:hypothetical protein
MGKAATLVVLLALVAPLPAAAAGRVVAPPGNSEADQYFQTLPSATGPRAPDTAKKARDAVRDGVLTEAQERALRQEGPRGLALLTGVARTAPAGRGVGGSGGSGAVSGAQVLDERGLGAAFPLVLALTAAGALAFALSRRRRNVAR